MEDKDILGIIQSLTLEEKAALCSGADAWTTKANPARGIPSLRMADGPHGLRYEDLPHEAENGGPNRPATCFPPASAQACSFSPELTRRIGAAIAEEALANCVGVVLGPGANIKRSPLCGRNFEYYSEDPLLSGEMAAGLITGMQEQGVGASLKHYAVNNQETFRMSINAAVDDRAMYDIYLRAFELAVKKAKPATVMASYNRVQGTYACDSRRLLTDILRLRFGFAGAVMSDWGAEYDRPAGITAGLDLEMPGSGGVNDAEIVRAVREGRLSEDALDTALWNLLRLIFTYEKESAPGEPCDYEAHHELAVEAVVQSAVLMKNEGGLLPLAEGEPIAVIGEMAQKPRYQGGGSSVINARRVESFLSALEEAGQEHVYTAGYRGTETNDALLLNAVAAAKKAKVAVLFLGLPDLYECEGYDRTHLRLPDSQLRLLETVAEANENVCVVLHCGSPVEMPWLGKVKAVLCPYLGGEGVGQGVYRLLFGQRCPAGRLPESWPLALEDTPCYHHFPGGPNEVSYNESLYVGYRYYDTAKKEVLFPFGWGLSYTQFEYSDVLLEKDTLTPGEEAVLTCRVKNTGPVAGAEVVQCYAAREASAVFRPGHELVGFARMALAAGEEAEVTLAVPYDAFGTYDTRSQTRVVETGACTLQVGRSSRDLPLEVSLQVEGQALQPQPCAAADGPYGRVEDNAFPTLAFEALYDKPLLSNRAPRRGEYTDMTPLGLMTGSFAGRQLLRLALAIAKRNIRFSPDAVVNEKATSHMAREMPFKNVVLNTMGLISHRAAAKLLAALNGNGSLVGAVGTIIKTQNKTRKG